MLTSWKESYDQPRQHFEKWRHYLVNKGPSSQGYSFSCGHVWMWELDCEESWAPKNWCFWTVVLEKTLKSPLDHKEIQPVHPKGDQSWVFIGRTDAEAETPILWPPDAKSWLIWKGPDAGKDWGQEEKGTTEDEMVGWHHQLNGHGFGWNPKVGDGQGGLACCGSWGHRVEHDWATELNWYSPLGRRVGCDFHFHFVFRNTPKFSQRLSRPSVRFQPRRPLVSALGLHACWVAYETDSGPTDCTPPNSSVHEILQARILEWVGMPSSRGSSWSRNQT